MAACNATVCWAVLSAPGMIRAMVAVDKVEGNYCLNCMQYSSMCDK